MIVYKTMKSPNEEAYSSSECDEKCKEEGEVRSDPESKKESGSHQEN